MKSRESNPGASQNSEGSPLRNATSLFDTLIAESTALKAHINAHINPFTADPVKALHSAILI